MCRLYTRILRESGRFMELTKSHRAYFKAARAISELSDFKRVKIGCVAVYGHRIISTGYNTSRTCPLQKKYNKYRFPEDAHHSGHAETQCLKPLIGRKDIDFSKVQLYIWRNFSDGTPALAKPCASCTALIKDLGIKQIYFTNYGGFSYEEILT